MILLCILIFSCAFAQQRFDVHNLHALRRVDSPAVSYNGTIVYSVRYWNETTGNTTTNLQIIFPGEPAVPLTFQEGATDSSPLISPDGQTVLFLSDRSGSSQIYSVPISGNEKDVTQVTFFPIEIDTFRYSPQGNYLVFSSQVYKNCLTLNCTAQIDAEKASRGPNTGFLYTELFVRHWDVWETGKVSHLFIQFIEIVRGQVILLAEPLDIMPGFNANCPVPPEGGIEQYAIAPDDSEIAFTAEIVNHKSAWTTGWQIYTVSVTNDQIGVAFPITGFTIARTQNPSYSPDASTIAYLAMDRPGFEADRLHINLYNRDQMSTKELTSQWDRSVTGITWTTDGSGILADADEDGRHKLFLVNVLSAEISILIEEGDNVNINIIPGDKDHVILTRDFFVGPSDIWTLEISTLDLKMTSFENPDFYSDIEMITPQYFTFPGTNGTSIQGWFFLPFDYVPGSIYPAVLLIHGGPQSAWNDDWSYRWNPQLFAARGYAVIMINPHGSTGFGQNFTDAVSGNWGGAPYLDLMDGIGYILTANPWIDENSVCALGASYGGYMINWILGQTDTFACLVVHDGMFDTFSAYFSTDELWFNEWEFGGLPWEKPADFDKWNPMKNVALWKTPTMVIHGGLDYRLPITQGLSTFTALQRLGIPSQLLYFPLENHWTVNPPNGIMWYDNVLAWVDRWTNGTNIK